MCGIAGSLELGRGPDRDDIWKMVRAISHRGPDSTHVDVVGPVGLGHARLAVIDVSDRADQPMWNEDRSVGVVLNGEIYNFRELRSELEEKGFHFRTRSDTEVALRLYELLGEKSIPRLDGMFALAIWDSRQSSLFLARDRAGKKPLFYYTDGNRLAFGSEIKALHAHPCISREPALKAIPHYLTYGYFPLPLTGYRKIRKLPPATVFKFDLTGKSKMWRYWSAPFLVNGIRSKQEAVEKLRGLMQAAVSKRLVADVPVGAFLSGGMDSTLVVGLMSREVSTPVRTFSIGFENAPDYDETYYADIAARAFGTKHTAFRVGPPDGELLEKLVHHHDGPFGDSSAIPTYIVSRLARDQVTVVLNGDGGDELFAGYHRFAAAVASERIPVWLRGGVATLGRMLPEPRNWGHPLRRAKRFLEVSSLPMDERYQTWCSFFPRATDLLAYEHPKSLEQAIPSHFLAYLNESRGGTALARLLHLNFSTYLAEDLLVKMDRCAMAHGLEARSPFLDTALIEFAGQLPDRFKLRGFSTKVILREAFTDLIPKPILRRGKMGFGVPLGQWLRGSLREYVLTHLSDPKARIYDHLRHDRVDPYVSAHLHSERDYGQQLFCLLTLEIWLRSF